MVVVAILVISRPKIVILKSFALLLGCTVAIPIFNICKYTHVSNTIGQLIQIIFYLQYMRTCPRPVFHTLWRKYIQSPPPFPPRFLYYGMLSSISIGYVVGEQDSSVIQSKLDVSKPTVHSYKMLSPSCYLRINNKSVIRLTRVIYPAGLVIFPVERLVRPW